MSKKDENVSKEMIDKLEARIAVLEKKQKKKDSKSTVKKVTDSLSDSTEDALKETGRILRSLTDSFVEAVNETADALSTLSDEKENEKLDRISSAMVSVFRKGIDIQKKAVEKFEESYIADKEKEE